MARASLYPPGPDDVPPDLTATTPQFRFQAFVVLICLFLFFLLYLGLVVGSAWLVYLALFGKSKPEDFLLNMIMAFCAGLLFLFLLKGFFKRRRREKSFDIEITEDEHPRLFDFIDRLCDEIGAPRPRRVFVNFEVNASAGYDPNFFNLFWSRAKDLRIGLGLVNFLNLTEFKALLAHEFGHFSQHSMKIGGYVYMARRIASDLVHGRDFLDDMLGHWCRLDIRIAWLGWAFAAFIWLLRKILDLLFRAIFFLDKALSRQMEFNADLVAVSVTGSDAPVHLLARSGFANTCLNQALHELSAAAHHHLHSSDLFYHQTRALPYIKRVSKKPEMFELSPLPNNRHKFTQVFHEDDEEDVPIMWLDHPTNFDREENAKAEYIRTDFDERPAWLLFSDAAELRERVSYRFYRIAFKVPKDVVLADPEEVQAFIDEEHAETTYDPRYHGIYDNRNIDPGKIQDLMDQAANHCDREQLASAHAGLFGVEVKHRAQCYYQRIEEFNLLQAVVDKQHQPKNNEIEFRGHFYDAREAKKLLKKVDRELGEDNQWFANLDRQVFLVHYRMALYCDPEGAEELPRRYRFHLALQQIWRDLRSQEGPVNSAMAFLDNQNNTKLDPGQFREVLTIFRQAQTTLADCLDKADNLAMPALKNITAGDALGSFLLKEKLVRRLGSFDQQITGAWLGKLLNQFQEVKTKVDRIHFKSLGGILALQEKISQKFLAQGEPLPVQAEVVSAKPPPLPK